MKIYAKWDAWNCELEYHTTYQGALNSAKNYLSTIYEGQELENMIDELENKGYASGKFSYNDVIPMSEVIAIDEIEVIND